MILQTKRKSEQECIPVGNVPSAAVAISGAGSAYRGVSVRGWGVSAYGGFAQERVCPRGVCLGGCTPPVNRITESQTGVKTGISQ